MKQAVQLILLLLLLLVAAAARAQIGIGNPTPDSKAALDIKATDKGLLIPRLTATQRTAITAPPQGLMVYQTDGTASGGTQTGFWYYTGTSGWVYLDAAPSAGLALPYSGTAGTSSPAFAVANTGTGQALSGTASGTTAVAVQGDNTNTTSGSGVGVLGTTISGYGVRGTASGTNGYGVAGIATDSRGVSGSSVSGAALYGRSTTGLSLQAQKAGSDLGRLVEFTNTNAANDSTALYLSTVGDRPALRAVNTATSAQAAIRGVKQSASTDGIGVEGVITSGASGNAAGVRGLDQSGSGTGSGVIGLTAGGYGVRGIASASGGYGVSGSATTSYGVIGSSQTGTGVYGSSNAPASGGAAAVLGRNTSGLGVGVRGTVAGGVAVLGENSGSGDGVSGSATTGSGVTGLSSSGSGLYGSSTTNSGVYGATAAGNNGGVAGVEGTSTNGSGIGVLGTTTSGYGVRGEATGISGYGVTGTAAGASSYGVVGTATGPATGVYGGASGTGRAGYFNQNNSSSTANALEVQNASLGRTADFNQNNATSTAEAVSIFNAGTGPTLALSSSSGIVGAVNNAGSISFSTPTTQYSEIKSFAAAFAGPSFLVSVLDASSQLTNRLLMNSIGNTLYGNSTVQGNLNVTGTLSKGGGSFKIDHPLDPENQYLYHSFVESPDMLNVYNGNVVLDAQGEASVALPDYFEALNRDFRYQLTPIGAAFTPFVKEKVAGNKFRIAGQPGAEVSWQVTGIRQDEWANQNRIPNAVFKEPENRGKYLHPEAFGQPAARGIGYPEPRPVAAPATPAGTSQHSTFTSSPKATYNEE